MKIASRIAYILAAVSLLILALYFSLYAFGFNTRFYEREYEKYGIYEELGMNKSDLMDVTRHMLDYLDGKEAVLNLETRVAGEKRLFFSDREVFHMEDVAALFKAGRAIVTAAMVALGLSLILIISVKDGIWRFLKYLRNIYLGFLCLSAVIVIWIILDFERAFVIFHEIFFNNDLWLLDPSVDLLINIVPLEFFIDISTGIAALFYGLISGLAALSALTIFFGKKRPRMCLTILAVIGIILLSFLGFFTIFKIIGVILLCLLGFALLLLLLVLFSRLRYNVKFEKKDEITLEAKARWLLGILRFDYREKKPIIKILFFKINGENKEKKKRKDKYKKDNERDIYKAIYDKKTEKKENIRPKRKVSSFVPSVKSNLAKVGEALKHPDRDKILGYLRDLIKKWAKALKPGKFDASIVFGFEDPSTTGMLLGLVYALCLPVTLGLSVAGNFNEPVLEANIRARGKVSLFSILWPVLVFITRKPVFRIIKNLISRKDDENGHKLKQ